MQGFYDWKIFMKYNTDRASLVKGGPSDLGMKILQKY